MPMTNPALNERVFQKEIDGSDPDRAGWAAPSATVAPTTVAPGTGPSGPGQHGQPGQPGEGLRPSFAAPAKPMTLGGTLTATLILFVFLLIGGVYGWNAVTQTSQQVPDPNNFGQTMTQVTTNFPSWIWLAGLGALGLAMVTIFVPRLARFTGVAYALAEGVLLGAISHAFDLQYNGIVLQAVVATLGVFAAMLFLYATRIVRVTQRFTRILIAAMLGIFLMYITTAVAHWIFGADLAFYNQPTPLGIGVSLLIVGVAAFSLMIDFDFIEKAVAARAPRYLEWYAAFGLMVGLVWLYLELLRLLALLRQR